VTATDAAGNATVEEVAIDLGHPTELWLVAPSEALAGTRVRAYAFSTGQAVPKLRAAGAELEVSGHPGVASATVRARKDVSLAASAETGQISTVIHFVSRPLPLKVVAVVSPPATGLPEPPVVVQAAPPVQPRWELGASASARYAGDLTGAGLTVEWRQRIGHTRMHVGVDLGGIYAEGNTDGNDVIVGGLVGRAVGELRQPMSRQVALSFELAAGGAVTRERRAPAVGAAQLAWDGGPSLGAGAGVLARLGPGQLGIRLQFVWTPLVGLSLADAEGGVLSVGYRAGRW
jgi:hypothetical protein